MTTLLVANRGEVAMRVFRTAKRMGMRCVAVYSDADAGTPFVSEAHEAVRIGPPPAADSYLRIDAIVAAAKQTDAQLIHPGYGFLAEDPGFADACAAAGLTFVGPLGDVLRAMGSKAQAKMLAQEAGVPTLDGYFGDDQSDQAFMRAAEAIGYPVMVKPVAGGGGKGMGAAHTSEELAVALKTARRAGASAFGDDRLMIERFIVSPRHVEVQILADAHGNAVHLGERDCSVQRRHQKVIEEAPALISAELRELLTSSAVALARKARYVNAGTVEYILDEDGTPAFMEMNARLQVEHPVTEAITGIDLVEMQLRVAMGETLPFIQDEITFDGHAIEARVYAEDPHQDFLPQAGRVLHLTWPQDARIDSGVAEGSDISPLYDPMLAKVIVKATDRDAALTKLAEALDASEILGLKTNLPYLAAVSCDPELRRGKVTTTWLSTRSGSVEDHAEIPDQVLSLAAAAWVDSISAQTGQDPWASLGSWRLGGDIATEVILRVESGEVDIAVLGRGPFISHGHNVERDERCHGWSIDGAPASAVIDGGNSFVWFAGRPFEVAIGYEERSAEAVAGGHLGAPMPGQILSVRVAAGDRVNKGQALVVMEAMKMEHTIRAPIDGVVAAVLCSEGDQVERGKTLVDFETEH